MLSISLIEFLYILNTAGIPDLKTVIVKLRCYWEGLYSYRLKSLVTVGELDKCIIL
jgi:hypothetical protein